jgi:hypothetical protein
MLFTLSALPADAQFCHHREGEFMSVNDVKPSEPKPGEVQFATPPAIETVILRRATAKDAAMLGVVGSATFLEAFTWALPGADIVAFCTKNHTTEAYASYLAKLDTRITLAVTGDDAPVGYVMVCHPISPVSTFFRRISN